VVGRLPADFSLNDQQIKILAYALHEIRPEWGIPSMKTLFEKNRTFADFAPLLEAAVKVARNPAKKMPSVIFMTGPHWDTTAPDVGKDAPKPPPCEDHEDYEAPTCRCCWADVRVGQRPATHIGRHYTPTEPTEAPADAGASPLEEP
jgi:hypothetical protein